MGLQYLHDSFDSSHIKLNLFRAVCYHELTENPLVTTSTRYYIQFLFTTDKRKLIKQKTSLVDKQTYFLSIKPK